MVIANNHITDKKNSLRATTMPSSTENIFPLFFKAYNYLINKALIY